MKMANAVAYKNVIIIGTSHIAKNSVETVKNVIEKIQPEIIALELDRDRYNNLMNKSKTSFFNVIRSLGIVNGAFVYIGNLIQSRLGKIVNVEPGSEMLTAIEEGTKINAKIALIDQHISITIKRLNLKIKDILFLVFDSIITSIRFKFNKNKDEFDIINFDLNNVPEDKVVEKMINYVEKKYPKFYIALILERNDIMTRNIIQLMLENPNKKIDAVMGAGHKNAVIRGVKNYFAASS